MMNNNELIELEQGSQEWLDARVGVITGSRVAGIIGASKYKTSDDVMREMVREYHGAEREFTGNAATEYGNQHEDVALQDFEILTGLDVQRVGFILHNDNKWLGVSPDGLIDLPDSDEGVEIKCPYSGKIETLSERPDYYAQVCLSLVVTNRNTWHFFCWSKDASHHEKVEREDADAWYAEHEQTIKEFYDEFTAIISDKEKSEPYLSDLEVDLSDNREWQQAVENFALCKARLEKYKEHEAEARENLIKLAKSTGVKKTTGCGVSVTRSTRKGNVQYAKIPELKDVDLDKYRGKESEVWSVR